MIHLESYAAVPGTTIRRIAAPPFATTLRPTTATTLSVFELSVLPRGLFSDPFFLLPSYPFWREAPQFFFLANSFLVIGESFTGPPERPQVGAKAFGTKLTEMSDG